MKSIIILFAALFISATAAYAQKIATDKVPVAAQNAFKDKFPAVTKATWKKENTEGFEANFTVNNVETSAVFDANGKWLETETEIKIAELPAAVSQAISKQFAGYKVKEASHVDTYDKGAVYEADIVKGTDKLEVQFSADGKLLSKKADKD